MKLIFGDLSGTMNVDALYDKPENSGCLLKGYCDSN